MSSRQGEQYHHPTHRKSGSEVVQEKCNEYHHKVASGRRRGAQHVLMRTLTGQTPASILRRYTNGRHTSIFVLTCTGNTLGTYKTIWLTQASRTLSHIADVQLTLLAPLSPSAGIYQLSSPSSLTSAPPEPPLLHSLYRYW